MKNKPAAAVDMTQGPIFSKLVTVAIPLMATAFLQMTHNLVDVFWLSRLSTDAVAAGGGGGMYIWLSMAFLLIGRMGAEIGVSQNMGRGDIQAAQKYATNSYLIAWVLGTFFGVLLVVAHVPLVAFFAIEDTYVVRLTEQYLIWIGFSMPFVYMKAVISGFYTGFGDTKTPFVMNTIGILLNIVLTPLFVFSWDMGVVGAAMSTTVAHVSSFFVFVLIIKTKKNTPFGKAFRLLQRPNKPQIRQIFKWGIPVAWESALFTILTMIALRLVAAFGTEALAALRVGSQLEALSWLVGSAFASATSTFIGQNWGAKNYDRLRQGFKISVYAMTIWGGAITIFLFILAEPLSRIFFTDPFEIFLSVEHLRITALMQIAICLEGVAAGSFRGRGMTKHPSIISISCNIFRLIMCYIFSLHFGLVGIWWGFVVGSSTRGFVMLGCYKFNSKKTLPTESIQNR